MRRSIAQLLALAILLAGVAWASDTHAEVHFGDDVTLSSVGGDRAHGFANDGPYEHSTAHFLGLLLAPSPVISEPGGRVKVLPIISYHSRASAPPVRPPKS